MLIEYACYDELIYEQVRDNIFQALDCGVGSISVPAIHMNKIYSIIPEGIVLSCPIDYPDGRSTSKLRQHAALNAIRNGATTIDLVANHVLLVNNKQDQYLHDLRSIFNITNKNKTSLRLMIDERKTKHKKQVAFGMQMAKSIGIEYGYCSTGTFSEDIVDNIILCEKIQRTVGINLITNATINNPTQIELAKKANLFGIRFHHINILKACMSGV